MVVVVIRKLFSVNSFNSLMFTVLSTSSSKTENEILKLGLSIDDHVYYYYMNNNKRKIGYKKSPVTFKQKKKSHQFRKLSAVVPASVKDGKLIIEIK